ncbi:hypothetical protein FRB99_005077 [Tulasnella sp. 403]|nr:hypothetical protein FRB99_005077 [Tulasnella sp. 403]
MVTQSDKKSVAASPAKAVRTPPLFVQVVNLFATTSALAVIFGYVSGAFIAQRITTVGGPFHTYITPLFTFGGFFPARGTGIAASLLYSFVTYGSTAALSVVAAALGSPRGYVNKEPRRGKSSLTGLPHRMASAHQNLLEIFPLFALSTGLTYALEGKKISQQGLNFLVLHVFAKTFIYIPAYLADLDALRTVSHFIGIEAAVELVNHNGDRSEGGLSWADVALVIKVNKNWTSLTKQARAAVCGIFNADVTRRFVIVIGFNHVERAFRFLQFHRAGLTMSPRYVLQGQEGFRSIVRHIVGIVACGSPMPLVMILPQRPLNFSSPA